MKQKIPIIFSKALYDLALPTSQSHFPPLLFPRQPPALFTELKSHCPSPHIPPEVLGMLGGAGSVFTYCSLSLEAIFPKFLQASLFSHFLEIDLSQKVQLNVQLLKSYYLNFPGSIKNKHTYKHLNLFFPNNS